MLSVDEAIKLVSQHTPEPTETRVPVTTALVGHVLAQDVYASEAVPAYRASIVDGYAVVAGGEKSTKGVFPVASITHANDNNGTLPALEPGTISRITTGAPLPPNANAVVMVEDTVLASTTPDGQEEATVEILTGDVKLGENVREPGSDVALSSRILRRGDLITSVGGELGLLASTGKRSVSVFRKPCVGVLSTGNELVEYNDPRTLVGSQIRDSNRPSLIACLESWGFPTVDLGIARDSPGTLEQILRDAIRGVGSNNGGVDIIVTTGGVSMGELDLLKPTIERSLGGTIHFGRVSMKPGKPTTFASIPYKDQDRGTSKLIFGLPGNPASAIVTLNLFVLPSLHKLLGMGYCQQQQYHHHRGLPLVSVFLKHAIPLDPKRTEYHRAIVVGSRSHAQLYASSTGLSETGQRSSRVGSLASSNALLVLQPGDGKLDAGHIVDSLIMGPIGSAK